MVAVGCSGKTSQQRTATVDCLLQVPSTISNASQTCQTKGFTFRTVFRTLLQHCLGFVVVAKVQGKPERLFRYGGYSGKLCAHLLPNFNSLCPVSWLQGPYCSVDLDDKMWPKVASVTDLS